MEYTVRFLPSDRSVLVPAGTTLLEAARMAELPVASACGENQLCALCGLEILEGSEALVPEPESEAHIKLLNRVDSDLRLSCHLEVTGDLVVTAQYWQRLERTSVSILEIFREGKPVKRAILLVDHGSRRAEANELLERVARAVRERTPDQIVEIAHMEIAEPTIAAGIARCVAAGARSIVVHPYFLGNGRHIQEDIPRLVQDAAKRHPEVSVRVSEPLGLHPGLIDAVLDRVAESE